MQHDAHVSAFRLEELHRWQDANPSPGKPGEWITWNNADGTREWVKKPRGSDLGSGMSFAELVGLDPDVDHAEAVRLFVAGKIDPSVAAASWRAKTKRLRERVAISRDMTKRRSNVTPPSKLKEEHVPLVTRLWEDSGASGNQSHGRMKATASCFTKETGIPITEKALLAFMLRHRIREI